MNDNYRPTFNIHEAVRKTLPYMMEMREYFHAHPELSEKNSIHARRFSRVIPDGH